MNIFALPTILEVKIFRKLECRNKIICFRVIDESDPYSPCAKVICKWTLKLPLTRGRATLHKNLSQNETSGQEKGKTITKSTF